MTPRSLNGTPRSLNGTPRGRTNMYVREKRECCCIGKPIPVREGFGTTCFKCGYPIRSISQVIRMLTGSGRERLLGIR